MLPNFSIQKATKIINDWYNVPASKQEDRKELFSLTEELSEYIKKNENPKKIKKICNAIIETLDQHKTSESEKLAQYVARKSRHGAYKPLYHLFKVIVEVKNHTNILESNTPKEVFEGEDVGWILASILHLDSAVRTYIEIDKKKLQKKLEVLPVPNVDKDFPNVPNVVLKYMDSFLDQASSRNFASTSRRHWANFKQKQKNVKEKHLKCLNCNGHLPKNLKIKSLYDLYMYFGDEDCKKINKLDLSKFNLNNNDLDLLKNFKNIYKFRLNKNKNSLDITKILDNLPQLIELDLSYSLIKNQAQISEKTYHNLRLLKLNGFKSLSELTYYKTFPNVMIISLAYNNLTLKDLDNLSHCEKLGELILNGCTYEGTNDFEKVDRFKTLNLEKLDLSNCQDIKTLPSLHKVRDLNLSECKNIDFSLFSKNFPIVEFLYLNNSNFEDLKDLEGCNNLYNLELFDCKIKNWSKLKKFPVLKRV